RAAPDHLALRSFPTRRSSDLAPATAIVFFLLGLREPQRSSRRLLGQRKDGQHTAELGIAAEILVGTDRAKTLGRSFETRRHADRSEEHTSELQSRENLVCRLL